MNNFNCPSRLSFDGNVCENWKKFKQQFEIYIEASESTAKADKVKINMLLNFAGQDAIEVFNTFKWTETGDNEKLDKVFEKFEKHCNPRKNVVFERYKFWTSVQEDGERIDHFVTRLKSKVKSCEYGDADDMVRDKLVFGIRERSVKERLLREDNLTLAKAITLAQAFEASRSQLSSMDNFATRNTVDVVSSNEKQRRVFKKGDSKVCSNCGRYHKFRNCPAYGKTCHSCKKRGHFESMCRSKSRSASALSEVQDEVNPEPSGREDNCSLLVYSVDDFCGIQRKWTIAATILNKPVSFKLDSGADCNVLSRNFLQDLDTRDREISKCASKLKLYDGYSIKPIGKIKLPLVYSDKVWLLDFVIVDRNVEPIIGLPSCVEMNLIKRADHLQLCSIENRFENVFEGLGLVKNFQYKIMLDPSVQPVVHAPRTVEVATRELLKAELKRMEDLDVIQKVEHPTKWVNSLLIVRKKNGKLRLCIDPRDLNRAIKRAHYPMKTIDDVVTRMPNAKVFSALDANSGFWQIALHPDSWDLCTFNTPFGRYCFKRLPFGIKSAPEIFQQVMSGIFDDLEGVEVVMDDILVWGETVEQHDERLERVLLRAKENNIKFNRSKCKFRVNEVSYLGHLLTENGVKADPGKVLCIQNIETPNNVKSLQRFLGMVTYLSRFIPNFSQAAAPLRELLEKDVSWHWEAQHEESFNLLKLSLTRAPVLKYFDLKSPICLSVDASSYGLGATLIQSGRPISYAGRSLTKSEKNYVQIERDVSHSFRMQKIPPLFVRTEDHSRGNRSQTSWKVY